MRKTVYSFMFMLALFTQTIVAQSSITWYNESTGSDDVNIGSSIGDTIRFSFEVSNDIPNGKIVITLPNAGDVYRPGSAVKVSSNSISLNEPVWNPATRTITFSQNFVQGNLVNYKLVRTATDQIPTSIINDKVKIDVTGAVTVEHGSKELLFSYNRASLLITAPEGADCPAGQNGFSLNFGTNCKIFNPVTYSAQTYKIKLQCMLAPVDSIKLAYEFSATDIEISNWKIGSTPITPVSITQNGNKTLYLFSFNNGGLGFRKDESAFVSVDVKKLHCGAKDFTMQAYWGGSTVEKYQKSDIQVGAFIANSSVGGDPRFENRTWSSNTPGVVNMNNTVNIVSSKIKNAGSGAATNVVYYVNNSDTMAGCFTYIDTASIRCKVGTSGTWMKPRSIEVVTRTSSSRQEGFCILNPMYIGLPSGVNVYVEQDVPAGEELTIEWGYVYPSDGYVRIPEKNYKFTLGQTIIDNWKYSNTCIDNDFSASDLRGSRFLIDSLITATAPIGTQISKDEEKAVSFGLNLYAMNFPGLYVSDQAKLSFRVAVPKGLFLNSNAPARYSSYGNSADWPIRNVQISSLADSTVYTFDIVRADRPVAVTYFYLGNLSLNFVSDCDGFQGEDLRTEIKADYYPSGTVGGGPSNVVFKDVIQLYEYMSVHCYGPEGLDYTVEQKRLTIGWADNDNNGIYETVGLKADTSKINHSQLIPNDTILVKWKGEILDDAGGCKKLYPVLYVNRLYGNYFNDKLYEFFNPVVMLNGQVNANLKATLVKNEFPLEGQDYNFSDEKKYGYAWEISKLDNSGFVSGDKIDFLVNMRTLPTDVAFGNYNLDFTTWFYATMSGVTDPFIPAAERKGGNEIKLPMIAYDKILSGYVYNNSTDLGLEIPVFNGQETKVIDNIVYLVQPLRPNYGPNEYRNVGVLDSVVIKMPSNYYLDNVQDFLIQTFVGSTQEEKYTIVSIPASYTIASATDTTKVFKLGSDIFDVNYSDPSKIALPDGPYTVIMKSKITSPKMGVANTTKYLGISYSSKVNPVYSTSDVYVMGRLSFDNYLKYTDASSIYIQPLEATTKSVTQQKMTWDLNLQTTKPTTPSYDVWLYLDGPVKDAVFKDASNNIINGTGEGNRWIRIPSITPLGSLSGALSMIYEGTDCTNESVTVYTLFNKETAAAGTWQPYPVLNDASFHSTDNQVFTSVRLTLANVESMVNGNITDLYNTPKNPSNPTAGIYGLSTIKVSNFPATAPERFPVEIKFEASGAIGSITNVYAQSFFPKGLKYVAGSAYFDYQGQITQVPVTSNFELELLKLTGGNVGQNLNLRLSDAQLPIFGASGEILGNKIATLRFLLEPTCDISMEPEKYTATFFAGKPCGGNAIYSGEYLRKSSSLALRDFKKSFDATVNLTTSSVNFTCAAGKDSAGIVFKFRKTSDTYATVYDSLIVTMPAAINLDGNITYYLPEGKLPNNVVVVPAVNGIIPAASIGNTVGGDVRRIAWPLPLAYFDALAAQGIAFQPDGYDNVYNFSLKFNQSLSLTPTGVLHAGVIASVAPADSCPNISRGEVAWADYDIVKSTPSSNWNGSKNNDWNDAANWTNGVPGECTDVVVLESAPNFPQLSSGTPAYCDDIKFEANTEVGGTPYLTYNNASLDMRIAPNRWFMVSAPLQSMYSGDYILSNNRRNPYVYMRKYQSYNPDYIAMGKCGAWTESFSSQKEPLVAGMGYAVWVDDEVNPTRTFNFPKDSMEYARFYDYDGSYAGKDIIPTRANNTRFVYESLPSYSAVDRSFTLDGENCHDADYTQMLIGNPFMSHLSFNAFLNENQTKIMNYFYVWGGTSFDVVQSGNASVDNFIAPLQSFVVTKVNAADASALKFTPEMATSNSGTALRSSSEAYENTNQLKIDVLRGNVRHSSIVIEQYSQASNAYNAKEDIETLFALGKGVDETIEKSAVLYAAVDGKYLSVDRLKTFSQPVELGIRTKETGMLSLQISDLSTISDAGNIYLEDRLLGTTHDLKTTPVYTFMNSTGDVKGRFFLKISDVFTGIDEVSGNDIKIYASNDKIYVSSNVGNPIRRVEVVGVQGQTLLIQSGLNREMITIDAPRGSQVVVVKVLTDTEQKTEKILLK